MAAGGGTGVRLGIEVKVNLVRVNGQIQIHNGSSIRREKCVKPGSHNSYA
jgi:hypothetical protein